MRWITRLICGFVAMGSCITAMAGPTTQAAQATAEVNLLSMGDWGTNGAGQRAVAKVMADYVEQSHKTVSGMLLVGDNFYMKLPRGVNDPVWQTVFERMYDPARLNFPFF